MNKFQPSIINSFMLWTGGIFLSLVLNLFLFGFMPFLVKHPENITNGFESFQEVNFIRTKKNIQPEKKKKEIIKNKITKKKIIKKKNIKNIAFKKPLIKNLDIPFEINSKLPITKEKLPIQEIQTFDVPEIKNIYEVNEIDSPIIPISKVPPLYPMRARRLGIEGWVKVGFMLTKKGFVENVEILSAEPEGYFETSVIRCVSSWRFTPASVQGEAVKVKMEIKLKFKLAD